MEIPNRLIFGVLTCSGQENRILEFLVRKIKINMYMKQLSLLINTLNYFTQQILLVIGDI